MSHRLSRATLGALGVLAGSVFLAATASSFQAGEAPGRVGVVRGTVVDVAGRGIADASVYVETDPSCLTEGLTAQTDSSGAFEIREVPAGLVRVRAVHPSFRAGGVPEVEVHPGDDPIPVSIVLDRGARVEGRVYHRDGRPFTSGWVIATSSNAEYAYGWPEPVPLDGDGAYAADNLPPGRGQVYVLALSPHARPPIARGLKTLSPIADLHVDLREGEVAVGDVTLRDVVVSGRVTRGGEAAPGVTVTMAHGSGRSVSFSELPMPKIAADPPALEATTADDGSYELMLFGPGPVRVSFASPSAEGLPVRRVSVPDAESVTLDFELGATGVSGIVVDEETGEPLPGVSLRLSKLGGPGSPGAFGATGRDGTFALAAEEGLHLLSGELLGRVRVVRRLTVGPDGLAGVRLAMGRGLSIVGRVVDASGHPAAGQAVIAIGSDGYERAVVRDDGTFRLQGLGPGPYTLSVGSSLAGFAIRSGVMPGPEPARLALRPAGKVALRVVSSEGRPVAEATALIVSVDGSPVDLRGSVAPPTDADGRTEIASPAGEATVSVSGPSGVGFGSVGVLPGETVVLEVELSTSSASH